MSLIGNAVEHRKFGKGVISDFSNNIVTVSFSKGDKKFVYPDAFSSFLVLKDEEKQEQVLNTYTDIENRRKEKRRIKRQQEERRDRLLSIKTTPQSQAVFDIEPEKLKDILSSETMFAGYILSGKSKGSPKIPAKLKPNSACILTYVPEGKTEKYREIAGIFMVDERFYGSKCKDGNISIHPLYRLSVPCDEHLLYRKYLDDNKTFRWGKTSFKYLRTDIAANIINDIEKIYSGKDLGKKAHDFKKYFFALNHLK